MRIGAFEQSEGAFEKCIEISKTLATCKDLLAISYSNLSIIYSLNKKTR